MFAARLPDTGPYTNNRLDDQLLGRGYVRAILDKKPRSFGPTAPINFVPKGNVLRQKGKVVGLGNPFLFQGQFAVMLSVTLHGEASFHAPPGPDLANLCDQLEFVQWFRRLDAGLYAAFTPEVCRDHPELMHSVTSPLTQDSIGSSNPPGPPPYFGYDPALFARSQETPLVQRPDYVATPVPRGLLAPVEPSPSSTGPTTTNPDPGPFANTRTKARSAPTQNTPTTKRSAQASPSIQASPPNHTHFAKKPKTSGQPTPTVTHLPLTSLPNLSNPSSAPFAHTFRPTRSLPQATESSPPSITSRAVQEANVRQQLLDAHAAIKPTRATTSRSSAPLQPQADNQTGPTFMTPVFPPPPAARDSSLQVARPPGGFAPSRYTNTVTPPHRSADELQFAQTWEDAPLPQFHTVSDDLARLARTAQQLREPGSPHPSEKTDSSDETTHPPRRVYPPASRSLLGGEPMDIVHGYFYHRTLDDVDILFNYARRDMELDRSGAARNVLLLADELMRIANSHQNLLPPR